MELVVGQIHRTIEQNGELGKKSPQTCSTDLTKVQKQCNSPENGTYIIVFNNDDRTIAKKKTKTKKTWAFTHFTKDSSKYIIECKMKNYETLTKKEKFSLSRAK